MEGWGGHWDPGTDQVSPPTTAWKRAQACRPSSTFKTEAGNPAAFLQAGVGDSVPVSPQWSSSRWLFWPDSGPARKWFGTPGVKLLETHTLRIMPFILGGQRTQLFALGLSPPEVGLVGGQRAIITTKL